MLPYSCSANFFPLSSRRTPLSKRLEQATAQRTVSMLAPDGREYPQSLSILESRQKSEANRKNILTLSQAPNCSTGVD